MEVIWGVNGVGWEVKVRVETLTWYEVKCNTTTRCEGKREVLI